MATSTAKDTRNMAFSRSFVVFAILTRIGVGLCETSESQILNLNQSVALINSNFSEPVISIKNTTRLFPERYARFLTIPQGHYAPVKTIEDNEIDKKDPEEEDPMTPLYGIYKDCLFRLSFPCVQRKLLVALDRISRLKSFNIFGDLLSIVRTKRELGPVIKEADLEARLNADEASSTLSALMEYNVERFLQQHVLRVTLPAGMTASVTGNARSISSSPAGNTIDINITRLLEEVSGRGKGDKKMKKLMGMMMTGLMGKMAFMGPFMVLLIKLKALKALILSKIALMLSLFHIFKGGGKKGGGGGHGKEVIIVHDAHGGGGGGGHDSYGSSGWATGGGGWSGGGGGGWLASHGDSYSSGANTGGGDATYAGTDAYAAGGHGAAAAGGGWAGGGGTASHGWGRRSASDPHWVAYRAYIPDGEE